MYLEKTLKKFHQTNRKSLRARKPPATTKTKTAQQPKWKRKKKVEMGEKKQKPANEKRLFEKGFSNCPHTKCPVVQQQKQQTGQTSVPVFLLLLSISELLTAALQEKADASRSICIYANLCKWDIQIFNLNV